MIELLISSLAYPLAISVAKLWLTRTGIQTDANNALEDLATRLAPDKQNRLVVRRLTEAVGQNIAVALEPSAALLSISDDRLKSLLDVLSAQLTESELSPDKLIELNMNATSVADVIRTSHAELRNGLDPYDIQYLDRLTDEVAKLLIETVGLLPIGAALFTSTMLAREASILESISQVLREIETLRAQTMATNTDEYQAEIESQYRRSIIQALDDVSLFGIRSGAISVRRRLSVAYIGLSVDDEQPTTVARFRLRHRRTKHSRSESEERKTVAEVVSRNQSLLVIGPAGSGKTTLLRWLAVNCARKSHVSPLEELNGYLPVYIPLRRYSQTGLPDLPGLISEANRYLDPSALNARCSQLLEDGLVCFLIDGLDEIESDNRAEVLNQIQQLLVAFPKNKFVITSRDYAIDELQRLFEADSMQTARLLPMGMSDITTFVDHWYRSAVEPDAIDERQSADLVDAFRTNRALRELASSPLLCAVLCALQQGRPDRLPEARKELYDECIKMFLGLRASDQKIPTDLLDYPSLSIEQKTVIVSKMASWMSLNRLLEVEKSRFVTHCQTILKDLFGAAAANTYDAEYIVQYLTQRSGLLRDVGVDRLDFAHRAFQDYLTALDIVEQDNVEYILDKIEDDGWHETVIMTSALAGSKARDRIIRRAMQLGKMRRSDSAKLVLLAMECVNNANLVESTLRTDVLHALGGLVPPSNEQVKTAMSSAGYLAAQYLTNRHSYTFVDQINCIETLGGISADEAISALGTYNQIPKIEVALALDRALNRIVSDDGPAISHARPRRWHVRNVDELNAIRQPEQVEHLYLRKLRSRSVVDCLARMPRLQRLWIESCNAANMPDLLGTLARSCQLDMLTIHNSGVATGELAQIRTLKFLYVAGGPSSQSEGQVLYDGAFDGGVLNKLTIVNDRSALTLEGLEKLTSLSSLTLIGLPALRSVDVLYSLNNLSELNVIDCGATVDPERLTLPSLRTLSLDRQHVSGQSAWIADLERVENLTFMNSRIDSLGMFNSCPNMNELTIDGWTGEHDALNDAVLALGNTAGLRAFKSFRAVRPSDRQQLRDVQAERYRDPYLSDDYADSATETMVQVQSDGYTAKDPELMQAYGKASRWVSNREVMSRWIWRGTEEMCVPIHEGP